MMTLVGALEQECAVASADLSRAEGLVSQAADRLLMSMDELSTASDTQRMHQDRLMSFLSEASTGSDRLDLRAFVDGITDVLTQFGNLVASYSVETMRINDRVHEVFEHVQAMKAMIHQVDAIADDTNILAINTALEAARAGEAGKGFKVVSTEIRELSKKTKRLDSEIGDRVESTNTASDAVRTALHNLVRTDLTPLVEAKTRVDEMGGRLETLQDELNSALADFERFASTVAGSTANAIRALQFEDIVNQVITAVRSRMLQFPERLRARLEDLPPNASGDDIKSCVVEAIHDLDHKMPAAQTSLERGDVELF